MRHWSGPPSLPPLPPRAAPGQLRPCTTCGKCGPLAGPACDPGPCSPRRHRGKSGTPWRSREVCGYLRRASPNVEASSHGHFRMKTTVSTQGKGREGKGIGLRRAWEEKGSRTEGREGKGSPVTTRYCGSFDASVLLDTSHGGHAGMQTVKRWQREATILQGYGLPHG